MDGQDRFGRFDFLGLWSVAVSRWNIIQIAFFGAGERRRTIDLEPDQVNVITGASGTGKSALVDAIDYCLGSTSCDLPWYVRGHAEAVAVQWAKDDLHLIAGRNIPRAGKGTGQMFVRTGNSLSMPTTADGLEGRTPREHAKKEIERAFGIADIEDSDTALKNEVGRATVRHLTPYLFLSGDVIVSKNTLLHDLNRANKARDIEATLPYFLGVVDQESVLAERRLRQLEGALNRLQREARARERSRSRLTERSMALLSQAAEVGLVEPPSPSAPDRALLEELRRIASTDTDATDAPGGDELGVLETERQSLVAGISELRDKRRALKRAIREAQGYESAVSAQSHKLALVEHLKLDERRCPVCDAESDLGHAMAEQIQASLDIIRNEVATVGQLHPELVEQLSEVEEQISARSGRLREVEAQIGAVIRQIEGASRVVALSHARAIVIGRTAQFLETTVEDFDLAQIDLRPLQDEIAELEDKVDPQAKRDRLRDAENMISGYATEMLAELPTEIPATDARMQFYAGPKLKLIERDRRSVLSLAEIGSDQNYLSIHLALSFALQQHFEAIRSPVPGLLVIDQISRPYYPEGGDEKSLEDMEADSDRKAMRKIAGFLFDETARRPGLQVVLIEHAYISDDSRYVDATRERWNEESGEKLIPVDWPERA